MKKTIFSTLIFVFLTTLSFAQSKAETEVAQAIEKWKQAVIAVDKAGMEASVSDGLRYGHSSGLLEDKAAFVEAITSGNSRFITMDLAEQKISFPNKNTAIVVHKLSGMTKNKGVDGTIKLHVLQVWQKEKGKWVMIARQATKI